jgi:Zn-dependent peptidase ImmA (M78 family)
MHRTHIEREAERLQKEIWDKRTLLRPLGCPKLALYQPEVAAEVLGLQYVELDEIPSFGSRGYGTAGILDMQDKAICISFRFPPTVRRFTGAHEIGHYELHRNSSEHAFHRDIPVSEIRLNGRPPMEREADYYAACLLAPKDLVAQHFSGRFDHPPLRLDEDVAFRLCGSSTAHLFIHPPGSSASLLGFASAVAGARRYGSQHFHYSLAEQFGISVSAMAIRLQELGLVRD